MHFRITLRKLNRCNCELSKVSLNEMQTWRSLNSRNESIKSKLDLTRFSMISQASSNLERWRRPKSRYMVWSEPLQNCPRSAIRTKELRIGRMLFQTSSLTRISGRLKSSIMQTCKRRFFRSLVCFQASSRVKFSTHLRLCRMITRYPSQWRSSTSVSSASKSYSMHKSASGRKMDLYKTIPRPPFRALKLLVSLKSQSLRLMFVFTKSEETITASLETSCSIEPAKRLQMAKTMRTSMPTRLKVASTRSGSAWESCQSREHHSLRERPLTITSARLPKSLYPEIWRVQLNS